MIRIERAANGYIVSLKQTWGEDERMVYATLDELFTELLMHLEGRCESFGGGRYGRVVIHRTTAQCSSMSQPNSRAYGAKGGALK